MPDRDCNETSPLATVIVKNVRASHGNTDSVARQWRSLNYPEAPDLDAAIVEYDAFVQALENAGATLLYAPADPTTGLDSIYVRDSTVLSDAGLILCNMGKPARRSEPAAMARFLASVDIPVAGQIQAPGTLEGGDVVWLGPRRVAVGLGYRTNTAGIDQLRTLLDGQIDELIVVPLPHWHGPDDVFHIMSMISPLDKDLALVHSPLLPVPFRNRLLQLGIELIDIDPAEFETQACNVLALGPRTALAAEGNPKTLARLEAAGVRMSLYPGREISLKGGGGPTCLTRPLWRHLASTSDS